MGNMSEADPPSYVYLVCIEIQNDIFTLYLYLRERKFTI